jgi:hypothetical protein
MRVARVEFQLATIANLYFCFANLLSSLRESFIFGSRTFSSLLLKVARLGLH